MISMLMESALRSLLVALAVWAGLRAFRIRNVVAQKAAWGLVLMAAVAMPLVQPLAARWQPSGAAFVLPAHPFSQLVALWPWPQAVGARMTNVRALPTAPAAAEASALPEPSAQADTPTARPFVAEPVSGGAGRFPAPTVSYSNPAAPAAQAPPRPAVRAIALRPATLAWTLYFAVSAGLLFRLLFGLFSAIRLWREAEPVSLPAYGELGKGLNLRSSRSVSSPVTIGSAVVLPGDYELWDAEKLRIVLAHERSHIRQGDFYLQLLGGLYAAIIWFSPLGWWIKRRLSDLAEAISDRAALEEAASRSSYAQILLQFAATPRPTLIGVAMARSCSLSRRIERLLNDSSFHQAFAGTRRRALVAVLLVPVALFAATALVRVEASGQAAQQPATQAQPDASVTGVSHPDAEPSPAPGAASTSESPASPIPPQPPARPGSPAAQDALPPLPPLPESPDDENVVVKDGKTLTITRDHNVSVNENHHEKGYSYHWTNNGDSYAVVSGDNREHMSFSGDIHTSEIDKARKLAHGAFLWFERNGRSYFVDDPAIVSQIEAMYQPMEELGKQQEELGRQQEVLGREQEKLGRLQEQASVPTPDMRKEMAELNAAMAKLEAKIGKTVTQDELADLEGKLGEMQGKLGEIQGQVGARQGEFGAQQGELGAKQGKLGALQGKLGAEQGRLAMEADRKLKSMIDESLRNGKAKPVE